MNDVTLTLLDPTGIVQLPPGDPNVAFLDGSLLSPPLPGGVFITPTITDPMDGNWTLRLTFPPAAERTVLLTSLFTQTPYQAAIVLDSQDYALNQTVSVGMLVLNDIQPITGLAPEITVTPRRKRSPPSPGWTTGSRATWTGWPTTAYTAGPTHSPKRAPTPSPAR